MYEFLRIIRTAYPDQKIGITFSCFDLLHAGHILMLEDAKSKCDVLIVGLQIDPTIDRPWKNKPILSPKERLIILKSIKYVDHVVFYKTEEDTLQIMNMVQPDIRILGSDWKGISFTGDDLDMEIYFHDRSIHDYSTSNLRKRVYNAENLLKWS